MNSSRYITLGIPKGSLEAPTLAIFERVGLHFTGAARSLWLASNDPEIRPVLLKPQEIPIYVRSGRLDAGLSGLDWIVEQDVDQHVSLLAELQYSRQTSQPIRWVLAVPEKSPVTDIESLRAECEARRAAGRPFTISTELTRVSSLWLDKHGIDAQTEFSWGATEAKAAYFSDAIIEGTETGASLRANGLREIAEVFRSTTQFFANREAYRYDAWKREKIDAIAHLIRGAQRANDYVQLSVVAPRRIDLEAILGDGRRVVMISEGGSQRQFHAVVTIEKRDINKALPAVIAAGACDAWVTPLNVVYSDAGHAEQWSPMDTSEYPTVRSTDNAQDLAAADDTAAGDLAAVDDLTAAGDLAVTVTTTRSRANGGRPGRSRRG
jgi:ATP phosphoribosyltransferase